MSLGSEMIEKVELYSRGKMSYEERASFEEELASNEQLQKALDLSLLADELVIAQEALKLKEQMRKDLYKSKPNWNIYALALLIALGGGIYGYYYLNSNDSGPSVPVSSKHDLPVNNEQSNETGAAPLVKSDRRAERIGNRSEEHTMTSQDLPPSELFTDKEPQELPKKGITLTDSVVKEELKKTISPVLTPEETCADLKGDVKFTVTASCKGKETGEVRVFPETVKGGKQPYTFILNEEQSLSHFDHLSSGIYKLKIKDSRNCIVESTHNVVIAEQVCKTSKAYIFNPEYDRVWSVPYDRDKDPVNLVLIDKSGKVFYQSKVQSYQPAEWSGESNMGLDLGIGLYFFTIEYSDGSIDDGTVTITR
ncbi:MAG: hypothetical protein J7604_02540 [Sporocytophaga sp.]|uniref:hypothetical protein n=1 Tax=Sporocytophaga sp. TaxID=2231183 RepID=UPI001B2D2FA3|nr:hypothetical protein [Sporocytophaga sp.]MBO9699056.1 hypothetical protein [Sporocytophaga sp.]